MKKFLRTQRPEDVPEGFTGIVLDPLDTKYWYKDGKIHRDGNKPAFKSHSGIRGWAVHGDLHRLDGPAIENFNGEDLYFIRNQNRFITNAAHINIPCKQPLHPHGFHGQLYPSKYLPRSKELLYPVHSALLVWIRNQHIF